MATTDRGGLQVMARLNEIIQIRILKDNPLADEIKDEIENLMTMTLGLKSCDKCHTWELGGDMYKSIKTLCKDCFELLICEEDDVKSKPTQVKKLLANIRRERTDEREE